MRRAPSRRELTRDSGGVAPRRRRRAAGARFPRGCRVQVVEDHHDARVAGRKGVVEATVDEPERLYPSGRVGVRLVADELLWRLYQRTPPATVWFRPSDLERTDR